MAFSGFDHQLLGELQRSDATWTQTYILQRILRGISRTSLFSQHVSAVGGMSADLPRVQAALESFADISQPSPALLRALCSGGGTAIDRALGQWGDVPALGDLRQQLRTLEQAFSRQTSLTLQERQVVARTGAQDIARKLPGLRDLLDTKFAAVWDGDEISLPGLELLVDEFVCLVAATDRDPETLSHDLSAAFRAQGRLDAVAVTGLLLPQATPYRVAFVVHGTAELTEVASLDPAATTSPVRHPERLGFGSALAGLRKYVQQVPTKGAACLLARQVVAVDVASSGRMARRELSELLDQYMAGHRLIELTLDDDMFVTQVDGGRSRHVQAHPAVVQRAVPLVSRWPAALRNGLRMAHVARTTEAPLPAAALAWSALEACGLADREELASALALQAMRQQIVEAHQQLHQDVTVVLRQARARVRAADQRTRRLARSIELCPSGHSAHADLRRRADVAAKELAEAQKSRQVLESQLDSRLRLIGGHATCDEFARLRDLNTWVDLLLPSRSSDAHTLTTAREALAAVIGHTSALTAQQVIDWSARLSKPYWCAQWLSDRQQRIATFVHALYGARNMSLHTGRFRSFGDVTLGIGGSLVVDFTLEVLGNWYRNAAPDQIDTPPAEVISCLAQRQQDILRELKANSTPLFTLNIAWLTSPTPGGIWTRHNND